MKRFFIDPIEPDCRQVLLDQQESRHLERVLRLAPGELVELFDGRGTLYSGRVEQLGKRVSVSILSRLRQEDEESGAVIVCQGDLKGGKMDFLVEKCTELGVRTFIPFTTGRSQGRVDLERLNRRQHRREAIVKTACKQSGRLHFMQVERDTGLDELIGRDLGPTCRKIMLYEKGGGSTLAESLGHDRHSPVCLMIGPEGGFSDTEAAAAERGGWRPVSLGGRILRAETAALAAVSVISHLLGRM